MYVEGFEAEGLLGGGEPDRPVKAENVTVSDPFGDVGDFDFNVERIN